MMLTIYLAGIPVFIGLFIYLRLYAEKQDLTLSILLGILVISTLPAIREFTLICAFCYYADIRKLPTITILKAKK